MWEETLTHPATLTRIEDYCVINFSTQVHHTCIKVHLNVAHLNVALLYKLLRAELAGTLQIAMRYR